MTSINKFRILWVDDQISLLMPYCKELEKRGMTVSTALSAKEALSMAKSEVFDLFLIDLKMPEQDGIHLLRELSRMHLQGEPIFVAFSSFHYLPIYRRRLDNLGMEIEVLDKDCPPTDSEEFEERFIDPIIEVLEKQKSHIEKRKKSLKGIEGINPFAISLSEFLKLKLAEKEILLRRAEKIAAKTIDDAFASGKIWVLLCGSPNTLATSAQSPEELPNEEQILEYAREMDSPPYQFFRSPHVDDLWMSCNGTHYPTVTLELLSTQDWAPKGKWDVHFDTGAPMCFFSYEDLLDKGIILPSQLIGKTHQSRKGYEQSYVAYTLKQQAVLECQSGDGSTISVKLNGQIVRDWIDGPYKRICEENCPYGGKGKKRLCIFRKALIGSNLVTDNHLKLVLDGVNKVTRFEKGNRRKN